MDDMLKEALDIVKAQASVRIMSEDEILTMVRVLAAGLSNFDVAGEEVIDGDYQGDPRKAIKEKSVTCLECGKTFKILTKKHLAIHGLTVDELAKEIDVSAKTIYRYETHQFKRMTGEILKCSKWYDEMWSELVRDVMKKGWR